MQASIEELERLMSLMISEHRLLLAALEAQRVAIRRFDIDAMESATRAQEAIRTRMVEMDRTRVWICNQLARQLRLHGEPNLRKLAELFPARKQALLAFRETLNDLAGQIRHKSSVISRVGMAVLAHLNGAVRLLADAIEPSGTYGRDGTANVPDRIGRIEAVG
jgi:hypothetical protein